MKRRFLLLCGVIAPVTFAGQMHMNVSGILSLISMLGMVLIAVWSRRVGLFPGFLPYTLVTVVAAAAAAGWFMVGIATSSFALGIAERVAALVGFQWNVVLAVKAMGADEH